MRVISPRSPRIDRNFTHLRCRFPREDQYLAAVLGAHRAPCPKTPDRIVRIAPSIYGRSCCRLRRREGVIGGRLDNRAAPLKILCAPPAGNLQQRIQALEAAIVPAPTVFNVNCGAGETITAALADAGSGATINVTGACTENVTLGKDGQRLVGTASASIDGDTATATVVTIGRNTRIIGLIITGGRWGVAVSRGGSSRILDSNISGAVRDGIVVSRGSYAEIGNNDIHDNGRRGIHTRLGSSADINLNGIHDNTREGISVFQGSAIDLDGNDIIANGNVIGALRSGVLIIRNSTANFSGDLALAAPNTIQDNGRNGIRCLQTSSIRFNASQVFGGNGSANVATAGCSVSGTP